MNESTCRIQAKIFCFIIITALSGCISGQTHVAGLEPQARTLEGTDYADLGAAEGESSSFHLFWFFPVTRPINYDQAVEDAVSSKGGDNLINVRFWIERQFWIMGTVHILHVRGNVIRYQK